METFEFSDMLVESAFRIVMQSNCKTEKEKEMFLIICEACDKHNISVRAYMAALGEISQALKELGGQNDFT